MFKTEEVLSIKWRGNGLKKLYMLPGNVNILAMFFIFLAIELLFNEIKVQTTAFMSHERCNYFVVQIDNKFLY